MNKQLDPGDNYRFDYRKRFESKPDAMLKEAVKDVEYGSMYKGLSAAGESERPRDR